MSFNASNVTTTSILTTLPFNASSNITTASVILTTARTSLPISIENVELSSWFPLTFFTLFICVWNALILIAFYLNRALQMKSSNIIIFNFACIDFFAGAVYIPLACATKHDLDGDVNIFFFIMDVYLTEFTLVLSAYERNRSLQQIELDTKKTRLYLIGIWLLSFLLVIIPLAVYYSSSTSSRNDVINRHGLYLVILSVIILPGVSYVIFRGYYKAQRMFRLKRVSVQLMRDVKLITETVLELKRISKELTVTRVFLIYAICFVLTFLLQAIAMVGHFINQSSRLDTAAKYVLLSKCIIFPIIALLQIDYRVTVYKYLGGK